MKVFISWSGEQSKAVAEALREFLPDVIQDLEPWMSRHAIQSGERWSLVLAQALDASAIGVVCLTKGNLDASWLHFEAGAVAKATAADAPSRVIPYLLDLEPQDVPSVNPLSHFQARRATREDTLQLLKDLNRLFPDGQAIESERLQRAFDRAWDDYSKRVEAALALLPRVVPRPRKTEELLKDVLSEVRGISQRLDRQVLTSGSWASPSFFDPYSGILDSSKATPFGLGGSTIIGGPSKVLYLPSVLDRQQVLFPLMTDPELRAKGFKIGLDPSTEPDSVEVVVELSNGGKFRFLVKVPAVVSGTDQERIVALSKAHIMRSAGEKDVGKEAAKDDSGNTSAAEEE
jgi:hypothetical protein